MKPTLKPKCANCPRNQWSGEYCIIHYYDSMACEVCFARHDTHEWKSNGLCESPLCYETATVPVSRPQLCEQCVIDSTLCSTYMKENRIFRCATCLQLTLRGAFPFHENLFLCLECATQRIQDTLDHLPLVIVKLISDYFWSTFERPQMINDVKNGISIYRTSYVEMAAFPHLKQFGGHKPYIAHMRTDEGN